MLPNIFQTSIPIIPADSLDLKGSAEKFVEKVTTTPADVLLKELGSDALQFGLKVLAALAIYFIGAWVIKRIKKLLGNIFERRKTDKAIASFTMSLVSISLTILLIILTVGTLGVNTTSLAAILAAGGMAIGMALSGTVQNFAGGIMLLVFKPFKAGDFIEAQGFSGTVSEVNIVSTKLTTTDNRVIVLPNGSLSSGTINNISQNPIRRLEWKIGVEYGSDIDVARKVILEILNKDSRVLHGKDAPDEPYIRLSALLDSSVEIQARCWVRTDDYWDLLWEVNELIYKELPKNGIDFPFPQLDVHLHN
ncbi:MAG: mechanosensitive ion channel [Bacteroidales bacterium]|nr:mechanosensitive ion channel [Bacteroidales bacterium]MDY4481947.1 mechanosensitive ion channel [Candidatus Cryptobacteroides sp.]MDY4562186.1 mechanosensitive ion channel [Candidatus Cryptobacteroides sp.]MDY6170181.1 mechanosensitive ion channel [Candidatus Cryptobacteroides sp.]